MPKADRQVFGAGILRASRVDDGQAVGAQPPPAFSRPMNSPMRSASGPSVGTYADVGAHELAQKANCRTVILRPRS